MKRIIVPVLFFVMLSFSGCKLQETINLKNCEYDYHSITNLSISGVDLSKGLTPLLIPVVLSALTGNASTVPLHFTLNVDVNNPNSGAASFQALHYIIYIDSVWITEGDVTDPFYVGAGQSKILPVDIRTDIIELNKLHSRAVTENAILNFLGLSDTPSKVTLKLKPSFKVGKYTFTAPSDVTVRFTFGGK